MPTNILRDGARPPGPGLQHTDPPTAETRHVLISAGTITIRAQLLATATADRIWQALPIRSTAEIWGAEIHFETVVESGRERGAKLVVTPGEIAFAPDRDVISIAYGRTPTSRTGELRLWSPSNVWAKALDDVTALKAVRPGEKVEVVRLPGVASLPRSAVE